MSASAWTDRLPSFATAWSHVSQRGPRVVAGLLLALIALQLALLLTRQTGRMPLPGADSAAMAVPRPSNAREIDISGIVNGHLFGQKAVVPVSASDAPASSAPLVLAGVYALDDPLRGLAIIGQSAANARLVKVGGNIDGGARLHSVFKDRVVIERGEALETVSLPKTMTGSVQIQSRPAPAAEVSGGQRLRNLAQNGTLLNGLLRVQAVTAQGKLQGFRVYPGGRNSLAVFGQLGLRAGDLITHINGTALDDMNRSQEVLQTLSNAASASVTVLRSGQPTEVNLNLTAVAQAAEEAVAADAAAAAEAAAANAGGPGQRGRFNAGSFAPGGQGGAGGGDTSGAAPGRIPGTVSGSAPGQQGAASSRQQGNSPAGGGATTRGGGRTRGGGMGGG